MGPMRYALGTRGYSRLGDRGLVYKVEELALRCRCSGTVRIFLFFVTLIILTILTILVILVILKKIDHLYYSQYSHYYHHYYYSY